MVAAAAQREASAAASLVKSLRHDERVLRFRPPTLVFAPN